MAHGRMPTCPPSQSQGQGHPWTLTTQPRAQWAAHAAAPRALMEDIKKCSQTRDRTETGRLFGTHLASNPPTKLVLGSVASMDLTHPMTSPTNAPWDLTRL